MSNRERIVIVVGEDGIERVFSTNPLIDVVMIDESDEETEKRAVMISTEDITAMSDEDSDLVDSVVEEY